jgi:hypothetical protein
MRGNFILVRDKGEYDELFELDQTSVFKVQTLRPCASLGTPPFN